MIGEFTSHLDFHDDGFSAIVTSGAVMDVRWEQVRQIVAFRVDPDQSDLMCLGFRISNERNFIQITEETPNYHQLMERMCEAFPEINRDWWHEISDSYGTTTIYGISQSQQGSPNPAERYLAQAGKRKPMTTRARKRIVPIVVAIILTAGVGALLSWCIAGTGWRNVVAVFAWPCLLVILVARFWPGPRLFFMLLAGYHLTELLMYFALGSHGPCLLSKVLLDGRIHYLLLLGAEILIGMGIMLLPDKTAIGRDSR